MIFAQAGIAQAQAEPAPACTPEDERHAYEMSQQARPLFDTGDMERARVLLEGAYAVCPHPILLRNLARVHEAQGDCEGALALYRRFLETDTEVADRGALVANVTALERLCERAVPDADAPPADAEHDARQATGEGPPPPSSPTSPTREISPLPWVLGGALTAVANGIAFGFAFAAQDATSAVLVAPDHRSAWDAQQRAYDDATLANAFWIGSGVVALAAIVWGILDVVGATQPASTGEGHVRLEGDSLSVSF